MGEPVPPFDGRERSADLAGDVSDRGSAYPHVGWTYAAVNVKVVPTLLDV